MTKVADIIRDAMIEIGALGDDETPSASEQQKCFRILQRMTDSWSNDELMSFVSKSERFDLVPGKQVYTMGPSGDFPTVRPQIVEFLSCVQSGSPEIETSVEILSEEKWALKSQKNLSSGYPSEAFVEYEFPLAKITVWPNPTEARKLSIVSQKPIVQFTDVNDTVSLPPGYEEAIIYNLAVRLQGPFQRPADAALGASAVNAKAKLMRKNGSEKVLRTDSILSGRGVRPDIKRGY